MSKLKRAASGTLVALAGRVERFAALSSGSIKHALCTEYDVGAGIGRP